MGRVGVVTAVLAVAAAVWLYSHQYSVRVWVKALYTLWTLPPSAVESFFDSYGMYDQDAITDNGQQIAGWYGVLNQFLTLGEIERMYIPPILDNSLSLSKNQDLMEERMARDMKMPPGAKVLDIGCGRGRIAQHMAQYGGFHVTGINIDPVSIQEAKDNAAYLNLTHTLDFKVHDYNKPFPFPDNHFDGIYEVGAIMYVKDGDFVPIFKEVMRMLKPGGFVAFNDWVTLPGYKPEDSVHKEMMRKVREVSGWVYLAKSHEMPNAMKTAGLDVVYDGTFTDHGHT
jgi:sterol 24-C-methyltransferase